MIYLNHNGWSFIALGIFYLNITKTHCLFENYSNCRIWILEFWHFPPIFVLLKLICLVALFDCKLQVFKNFPKWIIFGIFNELLSTQFVKVARFARNVEWDYFCDFQTPCFIKKFENALNSTFKPWNMALQVRHRLKLKKFRSSFFSFP